MHHLIRRNCDVGYSRFETYSPQRGGVNQPDDTSYPYKLEVNLRPPDFMVIAFIGLYGGSEEIVIRGMTQGALEQFVKENKLDTHPRLRRLTITGPNDETVLSVER